MPFRDHLEKVRYFRAVCEAGTFRKAAEQIRVSQSALTVAVAKLEASVGGQLLLRTRTGVKPTQAGEQVLAFARDLDFRVSDLEARLRAPGPGPAGRIRIGAYDSIAIYWLPRALRVLRRRFPNLEPSISVGSSSQLIDRLRDGAIDVGVVVAPPADGRLQVSDLFRDRFGFYGVAGAAPGSLIGMLSARVTAESTLGDVLRERGIATSGVLEVESFEIAKALAFQGLGTAILPERVAAFGPGRVRLAKVKGLPQGFGAHRICLATPPPSDPRGEMLRTVCDVMGEVPCCFY